MMAFLLHVTITNVVLLVRSTLIKTRKHLLLITHFLFSQKVRNLCGQIGRQCKTLSKPASMNWDSRQFSTGAISYVVRFGHGTTLVPILTKNLV